MESDDLDWGLKKEPTKEELKQLRELVDECWQERKEIEAEQEALDARTKAVTKKEAALKEVLEDAGMEIFHGTECIYTIKEEHGERGPESDADWMLFKGWMKEKYPDAYEGFFKMHMTSLKAFVKKERSLAEDKGEEGFSIPGIPEPSPYTVIKAKAKKTKG